VVLISLGSVCGDAANVAARLQELGKTLGRRVLVSGIEDLPPPPVGRFALRGLLGETDVRPLSACGGSASGPGPSAGRSTAGRSTDEGASR
jgi:class 3 adenylate cyclase